MERAIHKQVTSIVAGPGYGKTFAVYSFLRSTDVVTTWIQLTDADNSPIFFWETYCNAVAPINPEYAAKLAAIGFPGSEERFARVEELVRDTLKPRFNYVMVLDDLHLIHDEKVLQFFMRIAVRMIPGVSFIFISREEVITPYDLDLGDDDFCKIEESDLVFTKNEVAEYLDMLHIEVTPTLVDDIMSSTEGLSYLVNLAGRLLTKNPEGRGYIKNSIKNNTTRQISDQFYEELPVEIKRFLIKLSFIEHLSEDFISSIPDGRAFMTETMRRTSLVRYDSYMGTYHIHHLFLDFLRSRQNLLTEEEKDAVYAAAADWCSHNGFNLEAIGYLKKCGDYKAILDIVAAMELDIDFHAAAFLLKIFEGAPDAFFEENPAACVLYTRILLALGRFDDCEAVLRHFVSELERGVVTPPAARALMGLYNNLGFLGILQCSETGDYGFSECFEKAYGYMDASNYLATGPAVDSAICPYACLIGKSEAGEPERFIEAVDQVVHFGYHTMNGSLYGSDDLTRAEVAYFRGDMQDCERYGMTATFKAREKGQSEIENRALLYLLRMNLYQGKYPRIMEILGQIDEVLERSNSPNKYVLNEIAKSWFYASIEEREGVASWVKSDFMSGEAEAYVMGLADIAKCRYYIMEKNYHTLLAFIDRRPSAYGVRRYLLGRIGLKVYEAVARHHLKEKEAAFRVLEEAYELAEPNGFIAQFVEMGNAMRTLAGAALKEKKCTIPGEWLEMIRSKSATYAKRVAHVRSQHRIENNQGDSLPLTAKEKAILFDLSQGLSRTEIALGRGISINTVKVMLPIIFEKIGAESSIDAVRIALTQGLLKE
ncbi:MAG: LuxR C-terminal-related transcriptional regulator [Clostridiales Family XIII bacterium]|nr:LuxR C-terminal-related transcriptional regulator [Clostridiales Family XIII bacterium]